MNYRTLVALFLTITSLSAQAEERWFEIELLLFQRNADIKQFTEQLSSKAQLIDSSDAISLLKKQKSDLCVSAESCLSQANPTVIGPSEFDEQGNNYILLDDSHLQLIAQRERLQSHAGFTPILHMAWQMPVDSRQTAKPIHIFGGANLALALAAEKVETVVSEQIASNTVEGAPQALTSHAPEVKDIWEIDGNFKIFLDHYLYIDSQLIIRKAMIEETKPAQQAIELIDDENGVQIAKEITNKPESIENDALVNEQQHTVIKEVLFDQNRQLRSEEIHYLDHPLMGIIVQIRKIESNKAE